jgi:two-component system nitrate/nitrite response regulator NarL
MMLAAPGRAATLDTVVMSEPVRILVCAAHPVIEGVVRLAANATFGESEVRAADEPSVAESIERFAPSLAIVDIDETRMDRFAAVRLIRAAAAEVPVIVLADGERGADILEGLRLGIRAYLRKPEALRAIGSVMARVLTGEVVVDARLGAVAVQELGRFAKQTREGAEVGGTLTPREREILALLAEGFTMRQIGRRLGISSRTVETHVAKIYRKLSVRSRVQAVSRAAALGLIELR